MRVIEHEDFLRQPPDNALPTVHFPLCLRRNAGLRPGIFVRSVHPVHSVHSPPLKRRRKAAPNTPMLHFPNHSIPQIVKERTPPPTTGSDQIANGLRPPTAERYHTLNQNQVSTTKNRHRPQTINHQLSSLNQFDSTRHF